MILASHIIAASAITSSLVLKPPTIANAAAIFFISFVSHYLLDFIPHWEYELSFFNGENKKFFLKDLIKIFIDLSLGAIIGFLIIGLSVSFEGIFKLSLIIFFSCLPDILEAGSIFWKKFSFVQLKKMHYFFHSKIEFKDKPVKGIIIQIITLLILIILFI